jgi:hypothetical protein
MGTRAEWGKEKAARDALPPVARDFYQGHYDHAWEDGCWRITFVGLKCHVCVRLKAEGHRPSCPVPKAERALAKVAAMRAKAKAKEARP